MAQIDDKKLKELEGLLNSAISNLLHGPSGDPTWVENAGAAACFKALQILGLKIKNEKSIREELSNENIHNENFLKTFKIE